MHRLPWPCWRSKKQERRNDSIRDGGSSESCLDRPKGSGRSRWLSPAATKQGQLKCRRSVQKGHPPCDHARSNTSRVTVSTPRADSSQFPGYSPQPQCPIPGTPAFGVSSITGPSRLKTVHSWDHRRCRVDLRWPKNSRPRPCRVCSSPNSSVVMT